MDKNSKLYRFGKPFIIMVTIFIIVGVICFFIFKTGKIYNNKDIVYTIVNEKDRLSIITVPAINLKGNDIKKINNELKKAYENNKRYYLREYYYDYEVNDNILNLVTLTRNVIQGGNGRYIDSYNSYFINIDNSSIIKPETILKQHKLTKDDVVKKVEEKVKKMYQKEVDDKYINEYSCDFNCFKEKRNIDLSYENLTIGLENGKIVAYMPFYTYVDYGNSYDKEDFKFEIEK